MRYRLFVTLLSASVMAFSCNSTGKKENATQTYRAEIYPTENNQFGYDIFKDSVMLIHQPIIPGASGNNGFAQKEDAQKVAGLIIAKLDRGIMPPSVSIQELDSLGIRISEQ